MKICRPILLENTVDNRLRSFCFRRLRTFSGRVSYEPFRDRFMNVTRMCVTEARRCFDDFATSGENTDPDFIEERDVLQIWDDIRLVAGDPG